MPIVGPQELTDRVTLHCAGIELTLLWSRLIWIAEHRCLLVADTHFGKPSTFRQAGLPVPAGTTLSMLARLTQQITEFSAEQLLVLGDLVHSGASASDEYEYELMQWRALHSNLILKLVPGNHDRRTPKFYQRLQIELLSDAQAKIGSMHLRHDPADAPSGGMTLCGHIHPGFTMPGANLGKLPCYWLTENKLILPAFGEFAGLRKIHTGHGDRVYVICDKQIVTWEIAG